MAKRRPVRNLLGLAVLAALYQRPMHPYEIARSLKETGKEHDMGLKWGSFYTVIGNLEKYHLIAKMESSREGNRPERTTYRITEDGQAELIDWVRELVSTPRLEESGFRAGLSVLPVLHPDEAITLLRQRVDGLRSRLDADRASLTGFAGRVPRLFLIEAEYDLTLLEAEINWTAALADEFATGTFPNLAGWRTVHETGVFPPELMATHDPQDQRDN
jgi:DNA-binding PadR family transcriptional regulator